MRFGVRLTLFFSVTLVAIQFATMIATRTILRDTLLEDGRTQIAAAEARVVRQLAELEVQLAEGVRLLMLDFALRKAIADRDAATVVSALRNHGRRVGASQLFLIDANGIVEGATAQTGEGSGFPWPALLDQAAEDESAGSVAILDGKPVWLVVVPVMAPELIAYVAAALPLDGTRLDRISEIAGVPGRIGIISFSDGVWRARSGVVNERLLNQLPDDGMTRTIVEANGEETIVITRVLAVSADGGIIRVVLDYPLSEVMRHYKRVIFVLFPILTIGLLATLAGAIVISRGVARPIEALARQTKRIAAGDYTPPPPLHRTDELGQLSLALRGMTRAIAEREESIRHQAAHDSVTGLVNRRELASAINACSGSGAILAVGLPRWHDITSTVGREVGDRLLRESATRLQTRFNKGLAGASIGAIGESTFAVLLPGTDHARAAAAAARLIDAFDAPYRERELTIDAPVAVGIVLMPEHGTDAAQLLRRAEIALATAAAAETRTAVYRAETDPHRPERLSLMSDLRVGLTRGEFHLVYQPKLDLKQGRITGAEALVRWRHPIRGNVGPDDFITLAEETGNIQHLTRWALRTGLTECRRWQDQGLPARIAINLSVRDLADDTLPIRIGGLIRELQLPTRSLVLEVTESAIMGEPDAAILVLRRIDELGIDLAIDDFGVGQSSLAYLRRLPVREIKLDKAFVQNLADSPDDQTIVRSVTDLGHGLGYRVTAEGVEDARSLALLREFGCDHAQGYYIGKPMPAEAFLSLAASGREAVPAGLVEATQ